jgi:hypothetical protein
MTLGNIEFSRSQCPAIFHTPKIVTCSLDQIIFLSMYFCGFKSSRVVDRHSALQEFPFVCGTDSVCLLVPILSHFDLFNLFFQVLFDYLRVNIVAPILHNHSFVSK